ncbi:MAG: hydrolase TatD [Bacteroidetes bacterium GWA2_30_7]|nr:MAG: hydrolase TatD [Bacteroidetes bacterium GWA2_30_7]
MNLFDTHTHIYLKEFDSDIEEVINRSFNSGVIGLVLPNIDSTSIARMLELSGKFPDKIFSSIGLHPSSVKENYLEELKIIDEYLEKEKFIAIGEIGLDLYWDKTFREQQIIAFRYQIELSLKYNIPLIIHIRKAFDDTFKVLSEFSNSKLNGIFHCFGGDLKQAQKAISLGFSLGIGGVVTFQNSGLQSVVKEIPIEHIVLETDAPFLAPVPFRGKRNEPSYLTYIADKIAEIKNMSVYEVGEITTENAGRLFRI